MGKTVAGASLSDHYAVLEKAGRIKRPEPPPFPDAGKTAWNAFVKLDRRRPRARDGISPIGYDTILAFSQLTDARLDPWEIEAICALDDEYIAASMEGVNDG